MTRQEVICSRGEDLLARKGKNTVVRSLERAREARRELACLGGIFTSVITIAALVGWNPADPTLVRPDLSGAVVSNPCGWLGANVADVLYRGLGVGAWAVVLGIVVPVFILAGRRVARVGQWVLAGWLYVVVLGTAHHGFASAADGEFPPGGRLGAFVAGALVDVVGNLGAWIVLLAAILSAGSLLFGVSWSAIADRLAARVDAELPAVKESARAAGGTVSAWLLAIVHSLWSTAVAVVVGIVTGILALLQRLGLGIVSLVSAAGQRASLAVVRMWHALTRGEEEQWDDDEWQEVTGFEPLEPSDADIEPFSTGEGTGATHAGINPAADQDWVPTLSGEMGEVLELFPSFGPRDEEPAMPVAEEVRMPVAAAGGGGVGSVDFYEDPGTVWTSAGAEASSAVTTTGQGEVATQVVAESPGPMDVVQPVAIMRPAPQVDVQDGVRTAAPAGHGVHAQPGVLTQPGPGPTVEKVEGFECKVVDDGRAVSERTSLYFELPPTLLLDKVPEQRSVVNEDDLKELARTVEEVLASFKVTGTVTNVRVGPVVTIFEFLPDAGISVRKISTLADDLAMSLCAKSVRVVAPIPGKGVVGIEIPSAQRLSIYLREMLVSPNFRASKAALPVILGKSVEGREMVADLAKMPHLLVGGTTGSGKSVGVNGMLMSLLFTRTPEELRLLLIDPKKLEFEAYSDVPHLLHPVVTDPAGAAAALSWACREMDRRYELLARWKTRNIANYNKKVERESRSWSREKSEKFAPKGWVPEDGSPPGPEILPYIVIVIDELADLMLTAKKEVQESIVRLAQMARACGMHLIIATQRPSVDVVTGLIKSNLPTRIAFKLRSVIDSRTILDQGGAEKLLGMGDMLYLPGAGEVQRCHGAFVSDDEVVRVIAFLKEQRSPAYIDGLTDGAEDGGSSFHEDPEDSDPLYDDAVNLVIDAGKASTSMVQRQFKIGYNRAARIVDAMEAAGVVGPADGARPRKVLIDH